MMGICLTLAKAKLKISLTVANMTFFETDTRDHAEHHQDKGGRSPVLQPRYPTITREVETTEVLDIRGATGVGSMFRGSVGCEPGCRYLAGRMMLLLEAILKPTLRRRFYSSILANIEEQHGSLE